MIDHTLENLKYKDYWNVCITYFNSVRIPTLVKYLQYHKNDLCFTDLKKASLEDLQWLEEFCKKDKSERFNILYKWTCEQKYGKEYFKEHAAKGRETKEELYGKNFDKLMMQKAKEKGLEKDPNMAEHNAEKARETKLKKYGEEVLKKIAKETYKKASKTKLKKYGKDYFKLQAKENFPKVAKTKLERYGTLFPRDEVKASKGEKQVVDFVKSIYGKTVFENYTGLSLKNGKEIDIYIPEKHFAIEYDGWYFHSEANRIHRIGLEDYDKKKQRLLAYHRQEKTLECEQKDIRLLHILDLDWNNPTKQSILKSMIASALGIYEKKYFARKLRFTEIDSKLGRAILEENHLQGAATASKYFALTDEQNNPIQVMSFQLHSNHKHEECELNRMVTLKNIQVLGGFSKLLKNSLRALNVTSCTSYIDRSVFDGKGYKAAGFVEIGETEPCYSYIFQNQIKRREFGMRKNIEKLFNAGVLTYWNPDETERVNMLKNGIPRIWDCGKIKVRYELN